MVPSPAATVQIRDAVDRDAFVVTSVLIDAFVGTPLGGGLDSEPSVRRQLAQVFIGGLYSETIAGGIVRVAVADGEIAGAALWSMNRSASRGFANVGVVSAGEASMPRVWHAQLQDLADERCPPGVAHHRLLYLGVHPDNQGEYIGTDLLVNHHALLHLMRVPALVVADDLNVPLFQRHRYDTIGPPKLLAGGVPMSVMWRDPEPADPR